MALADPKIPRRSFFAMLVALPLALKAVVSAKTESPVYLCKMKLNTKKFRMVSVDGEVADVGQHWIYKPFFNGPR